MGNKELPEINYRTFNQKSANIQKLIRQSLQIIEALGIPIDDLTERQKEYLQKERFPNWLFVRRMAGRFI